MKLVADLFSSDVGLLSIAVIIFMLGMGVFFYRFFTQHMKDPAPKELSPLPERTSRG